MLRVKSSFGIHPSSFRGSDVKKEEKEEEEALLRTDAYRCLREPSSGASTLVTSAAGFLFGVGHRCPVQHWKLHPLRLVCARLPKSCVCVCVCVYTCVCMSRLSDGEEAFL